MEKVTGSIKSDVITAHKVERSPCEGKACGFSSKWYRNSDSFGIITVHHEGDGSTEFELRKVDAVDHESWNSE